MQRFREERRGVAGTFCVLRPAIPLARGRDRFRRRLDAALIGAGQPTRGLELLRHLPSTPEIDATLFRLAGTPREQQKLAEQALERHDRNGLIRCMSGTAAFNSSGSPSHTIPGSIGTTSDRLTPTSRIGIATRKPAIGPAIDRLLQLRSKFPGVRFSTIADSEEGITALKKAARHAGSTLEVFLDIDCGMHRTGAPPAAAAEGAGHLDAPGQRARDGVAAEEPGLKDTVLIGALETVTIVTWFENPGRWMYHCHILEHHAAGMMAHFDVIP